MRFAEIHPDGSFNTLEVLGDVDLDAFRAAVEANGRTLIDLGDKDLPDPAAQVYNAETKRFNKRPEPAPEPTPVERLDSDADYQAMTPAAKAQTRAIVRALSK